ncbi:hypothetical protein PoB_000273900 [Plakobranchus ocellatus]|uniref:Uncharacterized protein n=1 Tax=Plakobranchus ocellatus TaxID=259542 RepID=A0AAV3Y1W6_9GAST|nr:hypothetical protein PoB_000273900 [Plakobranchus ocellatus]
MIFLAKCLKERYKQDLCDAFGHQHLQIPATSNKHRHQDAQNDYIHSTIKPLKSPSQHKNNRVQTSRLGTLVANPPCDLQRLFYRGFEAHYRRPGLTKGLKT